MSNLLEKTDKTFNFNRRLYRAAYVHTTGLPTYGHADFPTVQAKKLYSRTRAKLEKVEIDESRPLGWYRCQHGFTPLFGLKK